MIYFLTLVPDFNSFLVVARPIPWAAPVTKAALPDNIGRNPRRNPRNQNVIILQ